MTQSIKRKLRRDTIPLCCEAGARSRKGALREGAQRGMPPLTKANCAAFKKVVPTKGIVAKKPSHPSVMAPLLPCSEHRLTPAYFAVCAQPASSGSQSGQTAHGGKSLHSSGNQSLALKALLETQARARAALAERHSQERTEFENACLRERSKLEAREDQSAAAGPQQEQRAQQQCVYCNQVFPSATGGGAAVELRACAGVCKAIKCDCCEWTSQCDDKEGFCSTCCLAQIGGPMFLPAVTWHITCCMLAIAWDVK